MRSISPHVLNAVQERMLRMTPTALITPDGRIPVRYIGRGSYAKAYRNTTNPSRVFIVTGNDVNDKDIAAEAHNALPDNPHLPAVERMGTAIDGAKIYSAPFYHVPVEATDGKAWRDYKTVENCVDDVLLKPGADSYPDNDNKAIIACVKDRSTNAALAEALERLVTTADTYPGNYVLDTPTRNFGVDADGNLILLDVIYDADLA